MSSPSEWPLPRTGVRFVVPEEVCEHCRQHVLCQAAYPLAMGYYPRAHAHQIARPEHDDHLVIYTLEGEGELRLFPSERLPLTLRAGPGSLIVLPAGRAHAYRADGELPWSLFWVHFQGCLASSLIQNLGEAAESGLMNIGLVPALVAEFEQLLSCRSMLWSEQVRINVCCRLHSLLSNFAVQVQRADQKFSGVLDINAVHGLMLSRVEGSLELDELAAHFHYSRFYFAKIYKQLTGTTPIRQFIQYKMEHASYLLDSTGLPINHVAMRLGYDDAYYFSRLFKKFVGVSPREYRNRL